MFINDIIFKFKFIYSYFIMNFILRCFKCKKQSKKDENNTNASNIKFNIFVNQETNIQNNISLNLGNKSEIKNQSINENNNIVKKSKY